MAKNRDGKPTEFQLRKITEAKQLLRMDIKTPKTYREAENALKRIKRANAASPKTESPKKPSNGKNCYLNAKPFDCSVSRKQAKKDSVDIIGSAKITSSGSTTVTIDGKVVYRQMATDLLAIIADIVESPVLRVHEILRENAGFLSSAGAILYPEAYKSVMKALKAKKAPPSKPAKK